MRKLFLSLALLGSLVCAYAQNIKWGEEIPAAAADILKPRLEQMLSSAGLADVPLEVSATVTERMETPGSLGQVALVISLQLCSGEVSEQIPLKGVGDTEEDAWLRAMKQFLPKGKAAQNFIKKLNN